jgi:hypothetical protein
VIILGCCSRSPTRVVLFRKLLRSLLIDRFETRFQPNPTSRARASSTRFQRSSLTGGISSSPARGRSVLPTAKKARHRKMTKITFVLRAKLPPVLIARTKKRFARRFAPAFSNSCRTFRSEFATSFQVSSTSTRRHCSHARARSRPGRARRKIDRAR